MMQAAEGQAMDTIEVRPPVEARNELFEIVGRYSGAGEPIVGGDIEQWLLDAGRLIPGDAEFFDELCWRILGAGLPLWRANISVRTLHPQILGLSFRWWRNRRLTEVVRVGHGARETSDYLDSPIRRVIEHGEQVRIRFDDEAAVARFPFLVDLQNAGGTDYFACPLSFYGGSHHAATFATDRQGGFSDACIAKLMGIVPSLSAVIEARSMRRLAGTLLNVYLGRTAGERVLNGEIRRAEGERMSAVLMATDMRGFTYLSDRLPPPELIALLDDYFEAVTAPVEAHGGEVLKFVGDGVLAIFPYDGDPADAAESTLAAAVEGLARISRLNERRRAEGRIEFRIGVGLHLGDVIFGNVGSLDRLDFTAIGPAVNLACRLETLTKRLERPLLVSRDFARTCRHAMVSLGFHPVRGLSEPEEVFGLPDGDGLGGEMAEAG